RDLYRLACLTSEGQHVSEGIGSDVAGVRPIRERTVGRKREKSTADVPSQRHASGAGGDSAKELSRTGRQFGVFGRSKARRSGRDERYGRRGVGRRGGGDARIQRRGRRGRQRLLSGCR